MNWSVSFEPVHRNLWFSAFGQRLFPQKTQRIMNEKRSIEGDADSSKQAEQQTAGSTSKTGGSDMTCPFQSS